MDPLTIARNVAKIRQYLETVNDPIDVVADTGNAAIDTAAGIGNAAEDIGTFFTDTLPTNFSRGADILGENLSRGGRSILHSIAERQKSRRNPAYVEEPFVDIIPVDSQGNPVGDGPIVAEEEPVAQSPVEQLRQRIAEAYPGGGTFSQTGQGFTSQPGAGARIAAYNAADTLRRRSAGMRSQASGMEREIANGARPFWQRKGIEDFREQAGDLEKLSATFSDKFADLSASKGEGSGAQEAYGKAVSSVFPRLLQQSDGTPEGAKLAEQMAHRIALSQLPESMRRTIVPFSGDTSEQIAQLEQAASQVSPDDESGWGELAGTAIGLLGLGGAGGWLVKKLGGRAAPILSKILGKKSPTAVVKELGPDIITKPVRIGPGPVITTRPIPITKRLEAPTKKTPKKPTKKTPKKPTKAKK